MVQDQTNTDYWIRFVIREVDKSLVPDNTDPRSDSGNFPFEAHDYLVVYDCHEQPEFCQYFENPGAWHCNAVFEIKNRILDSFNSWGK